MSITAFPLAWPLHFPRTKYRETGRFHTGIARALGNVEASLEKFAKDSHKELCDVVISSNVTRAIQRPEDPGIAVWALWDGMQVCIPVDRYTSVSNNLQAVHYIIEARRSELRHGSLELVRAAFRGSLLATPQSGQQWWEVLEVDERASKEEIRAAYRRKVSTHHPDKGGDTNLMAEINAAFEEAQYA